MIFRGRISLHVNYVNYFFAALTLGTSSSFSKISGKGPMGVIWNLLI